MKTAEQTYEERTEQWQQATIRKTRAELAAELVAARLKGVPADAVPSTRYCNGLRMFRQIVPSQPGSDGRVISAYRQIWLSNGQQLYPMQADTHAFNGTRPEVYADLEVID